MTSRLYIPLRMWTSFMHGEAHTELKYAPLIIHIHIYVTKSHAGFFCKEHVQNIQNKTNKNNNENNLYLLHDH